MVQAQLPPAFGPDGLAVLEAFVRRLPTDFGWAVELRHPGWFDRSDAHARLDALLIERGVGRVVLDTRPLYATPARSSAAVEERSNKPRLPVVTEAVGARPIVRVIGEDRAGGTFRGLGAWLDQMRERVPEVPPLPEPRPVVGPQPMLWDVLD